MKRGVTFLIFSTTIFFSIISVQAISNQANDQTKQRMSSLVDSSEMWRFNFSLHPPAMVLCGEIIEIIYLDPDYGQPSEGCEYLDFEQIPAYAEAWKQWLTPLSPLGESLIVEVMREDSGNISAVYNFIHQPTGYIITAHLTGRIVDDKVSFHINYSIPRGLQNYSFTIESNITSPGYRLELNGTVFYSIPANLIASYEGMLVDDKIEGTFIANVTDQWACWPVHVKAFDYGYMFYDALGEFTFHNITMHGDFEVDIGVQVICPDKPPKLAIDLIHNGYADVNIQSQAISLGYEIREIVGDVIRESDLEEIDIVLLYVPSARGRPNYTQDEIKLIVNFVQNGGALYIVPMSCNTTDGVHDLNIAESVNTLYSHFGFELSGEHYVFECPTKVVNSNSLILEGVNSIQIGEVNSTTPHPCSSVAILSQLMSPCEAILLEEGHPLFLVSGLGTGRVFVDLTSYGIGSQPVMDNMLIVRNAIIWLKRAATDVYRIIVGEALYDIGIETNSTLSSLTFDNSSAMISFMATGLEGTTGFCNITIPKNFMWCDNIEKWNITVNGLQPLHIEKTEDASNTYIYITYKHSTHTIEVDAQHVVPEFPSFLILSLFMIVTLLAVIVYRRKHIA